MNPTRPFPFAVVFLTATSAIGCNAIIGLSDFTVGPSDASTQQPGPDTSTSDDGSTGAGGGTGGSTLDDAGSGGSSGSGGGLDAASELPPPECVTNKECTDRATAAALDAGVDAGADAEAGPGDGGAVTVPAVCVKPEGKCVPLFSDDCTTVTGDYLNDKAILLGSLFSTKGSQAATNLLRQKSATLAVEEINVGGIPSPVVGVQRQLVMVSCDESTNLTRAATHLVNDLHVPAIVGPNTSQDTIDVSKNVTILAGTVVITPTAVASSIPELPDNDLTWLMVPSDVQRAPLMISQINALEAQLKADRGKQYIRLGIIFRNDALGIGTRSSLDALILNGKPLSDSINLGNNVQIDGYDFKIADQSPIVNKYSGHTSLNFVPDIIVLAGTAEAITNVMVPLENAWTYDAGSPGNSRSYYVLIDSGKVTELITAVTGKDDLRRRVRGTGITPGGASVAVNNSFSLDYQARYGNTTIISGMGPSYDAAYAIGYALAATYDLPVTGANIAKGLRKLASGATFEVGGKKVQEAFLELSSGKNITAVGTFTPLDWDTKGAVKGGTLEMWCIAGTPKISFKSSGLTYDIKTTNYTGAYTQCGP